MGIPARGTSSDGNGLQHRRDSDPDAFTMNESHFISGATNKGGRIELSSGASTHAKADSRNLYSSVSIRRVSESAVFSSSSRNAAELSSMLPPQKHELNAPVVEVWEIIMLTCFNFPYGLICGTMGLVVLPAEAIHLYPQTSSVTLGLSLLLIGVSQLVCPLAGRVSDSWPSATFIGKRRPFMLWGCLVGAGSCLLMWLTSIVYWGIAYYTSLFIGMLALNVLYSVQCGLVPDFVGEESQGKASGIVAVHGVVGSGLGFAIMIAARSSDFHFVYPVYASLTVFTVALSVGTANRIQSRISVAPRGENFTSHSHRFEMVPQNDGGGDVKCDPSPKMRESLYSDATAMYSTSTESIEGYECVASRGGHTQPTRVRSSESTSANPSDSAASFSTSVARSGGGGGSSEDQQVHRGRAQRGATAIARGQSVELTTIPHAQTSRVMAIQSMMVGRSERLTGFWSKKFLNLTFADIVESYTADLSESMDFFWVFIGRTFYYVAVSVTAFITFFLRDIVGTVDPRERQLQIGCIALVAQGTAACIAYPMGKLSDNPQIGKKPLIYVACVCMSLVYVGFLICPIFGKYAFLFVLAVSVIFGAANGCFLAVDYGLALATLPDKAKAAQALGIWGVSAFIGSAVGPLLWGALIQFFGGQGVQVGGLFRESVAEQQLDGTPAGTSLTEEKRFGYLGYEAMLLGGMVATICAAVMISFVKLKERPEGSGEETVESPEFPLSGEA